MCSKQQKKEEIIELLISIIWFIVVMVYFIYIVYEMRLYAPWKDETANLLAMRNFLSDKTFRVGPEKGDINFELLPFYQIYYTYAVELFIRVPFFWIAEKTGCFAFNYVPGFLMLIGANLLIYLILRKSQMQHKYMLVPLIWGGCASVYSLSNVFHYIRYMSFYMISIVLAVFICCHIHHLLLEACEIKKIILLAGGLLIGAIIPLLFNQTGIVFMVAVFFASFLNLIKEHEIAKYVLLLKKHRCRILFIGAVFLLSCLLLPVIKNLTRVTNGITDISIRYIPEYLSLVIGDSVFLRLLYVFSAIFLIAQWKTIDRDQKYILLVCLTVFIIYFALAPFIGKRFKHMRYLILPEVSCVIITSIVLLLFVQWILRAYSSLRVYLVLLGVLFCCLFSVKRIDSHSEDEKNRFYFHLSPFLFSIVSEYSNYVNNIKTQNNYNIIVFTDVPSCINYYIPNIKLYMLRDVPDDIHNYSPETLLSDGICFMLKDGRVKNIYNDEYIGDMDYYIRLLKSIDDPSNTVIIYLAASNKGMSEEMKVYYDNNPILWNNELTVQEHIEIAIKNGVIK